MHETGDNLNVAIRNDRFKNTTTQEHDRCDHTNTILPYPIRTQQLSVLVGSSTRMGDQLGSPRVAPLFLGLTGTIPPCHLSTQWVPLFIQAVKITRFRLFPFLCRVEDSNI